MYVRLYQQYQPSLLPLLPSVLSPPNPLTVTSIFLTFYRYHPYPFLFASTIATCSSISINANIASTPNPTAIRNIMEHRVGGSRCGCSHQGREYFGPCWALRCASGMHGVMVSDWINGENVLMSVGEKLLRLGMAMKWKSRVRIRFYANIRPKRNTLTLGISGWCRLIPLIHAFKIIVP